MGPFFRVKEIVQRSSDTIVLLFEQAKFCFSYSSNIYIRASHRSPVKPELHVQLNAPVDKGEHIPWSHGEFLHGSAANKTKTYKKSTSFTTKTNKFNIIYIYHVFAIVGILVN
jgi:hypothetical protein